MSRVGKIQNRIGQSTFLFFQEYPTFKAVCPSMWEVEVGTLRSLLNELARLRIVTVFKQASLFNRDLRVNSGPR